MHQLIDSLFDEAKDTERYRKQLEEIVELDRDFRLIEEYFSLAKSQYQSLARHFQKNEKPLVKQ